MVDQQLHRSFDIPRVGRPPQGPVIFLGQLAQAHRFEVEAQEALFFVQSVLYQFQ
ncbi:hypothetical protein D3C78_1618520 [compost metagenome]